MAISRPPLLRLRLPRLLGCVPFVLHLELFLAGLAIPPRLWWHLHPNNGQLIPTDILCVLLRTNSLGTQFLSVFDYIHLGIDFHKSYAPSDEQGQIQNVPSPNIRGPWPLCRLAFHVHPTNEKQISEILPTKYQSVALGYRRPCLYRGRAYLWV